ncbi:sensor histidine kinase [Microbulbifer sp.]|uniref:sensor histidine kinase n=1 Tax=Microbulbifer sp. TaxID=1908541 RepID=UPI003F3BBC07
MKSISVKLILIINLLLLLAFASLVLVSELFLQDYYVFDRKSDLDQLVTDLKNNLNGLQNPTKFPRDAIVFEVKQVKDEAAFNAEIRENLVKHRIQFNKIWFPLDKIKQTLDGADQSYFARQPLINNYLLVKIFSVDDQRIFFAGYTLVDIEQTLDTVKRFVGYIAIVVLAISSVIISAVSFRITHPISQITGKTRRMAKLDFSGNIDIHTRDELAQLGYGINQLSDKLQQTLIELDATNRRLEKEISHRERLDAFRKEFIGNASHELKTPIALIGGYAQGLLDNIADENTRESFARIILEESNQMAVLLEELLTLSEAEHGFYKLDISSFDVAVLLEVTVAKYCLDIDSKHIRIVVPAGPYWVRADRKKIERVIVNFLSNAIEHVGVGGKIAITATEDNNEFRFNIFNSGSRINMDMEEEIWKPFVRTPNPDVKKFGSAGLGLAIIASILKQHDSRFGARNTGEGVEFYFTLSMSSESDVSGHYPTP